MKKATISTIIMLVVAVGTYVVLANQQESGMMGGGMMGRGMMDNNDIMMQRRGGMMRGGMMDSNDMMMQRRGWMAGQGDMMGMNQMHMMMAQSMMNISMVPTEEGGVIVLAYDKLLKYNKNLELVKEVELKIDTEQMQKKVEDMMNYRPMRQRMMQRGMMGRSQSSR
jgi:hypothetical protein